MGRFFNPVDAGLAALMTARGRLFVWVPVLMAFGIGGWFGLADEPGQGAYALAGLAALGGAAAGTLGPERWRAVAVAIGCVAFGFMAAGVRSDSVAGPILSFRYYGPVEGRVVMIDRSQSDVTRLTLDQVVLARVSPERTPRRVRVSMHGAQGFVEPEPGLRVMMTAHLAAPDGPVEPGGFDFQRMAWFRSLGAVGYTRTPVLMRAPPDPADQRVNRFRMRISGAVQNAVPGEPGAFAAAVLTGDRSGIGQDTLQSLRDSNLAHLLAISGLHMGLLTAFVFAGVRMGLALIPPLALRVPGKKVAAIVALGAAAFYLALSGGNVATIRAFVMAAVMLCAVLADRRALSMRSVAMAAIILLTLWPESLTEPGFQMSFAATTALIAGFGVMRRRSDRRLASRSAGRRARVPGWVRAVVMLVLSSALAGFATAPVAAAHFNRIAEYGLLANLLAVPMMGTFIIPAAVIAAILAPFGFAAPPLWVIEQGTRWILFVSDIVAGLEGAVVPVVSPGPRVLPLMALGSLWLMLISGWTRAAGLVAVLSALWLWQAQVRPAVLIASDGGLVGVLGPQGRVLSKSRGSGFAAANWLENDGDVADQAGAAARVGFTGVPGDLRFVLPGGLTGAHLSGRGASDRLEAACAEAVLVVLAANMTGSAPEGCRVIDRRFLARTGALALEGSAPARDRWGVAGIFNGGAELFSRQAVADTFAGAEFTGAEPTGASLTGEDRFRPVSAKSAGITMTRGGTHGGVPARADVGGNVQTAVGTTGGQGQAVNTVAGYDHDPRAGGSASVRLTLFPSRVGSRRWSPGASPLPWSERTVVVHPSGQGKGRNSP